MEPVTVTKVADVEAALLDASLIPPAAPDTLQSGATATLRNAMARFSGGDAHAAPRAAAEQAISAMRHRSFSSDAGQRTTTIINTIGVTRNVEAVADLAFVVPVETVAAALGVAKADLTAVREDVRSIVEVIGRRLPSSPASDTAVERLTSRMEAMGHDAVAAVSLLYQSHDASAALFGSVLLANQTGQRRRPAIAATSRIATTDTMIGAHKVAAGTTVVVDVESSRFEFGLGAHACPGREIVERIVGGMVQAIQQAGLEIAMDAIAWLEDGRPGTLPLSPMDIGA